MLLEIEFEKEGNGRLFHGISQGKKRLGQSEFNLAYLCIREKTNATRRRTKWADMFHLHDLYIFANIVKPFEMAKEAKRNKREK